MDPRYPPSKRRRPVREDRIILRASLETAIAQASGFSLLKDPHDHARDRKQRKLHLALSLNVLFIDYPLLLEVVSFLNCFA